MLELEVMCIAGDFIVHVGVEEPGEEECVDKFGWGARNSVWSWWLEMGWPWLVHSFRSGTATKLLAGVDNIEWNWICW